MTFSAIKTLVQSGWVGIISFSDLEAGKTTLNERIAHYQQQPKPLMDYQAKELDLFIRILSDVQLELDARNPFLQSWH
ncbi:hypothetical protein [Siphonobacter curvatus]|uniref:Uncharacterized protein n=1 Tax=Siphonobacter curvatus TaxID=2094562 RepID=A0A2S7INK2_9BACT|nr:hypothetical protein [Siphonobacter curvatus]PQA59140.1 hypothetical protein C5O19_05655 [Siphonobacter curvatus]